MNSELQSQEFPGETWGALSGPGRRFNGVIRMPWVLMLVGLFLATVLVGAQESPAPAPATSTVEAASPPSAPARRSAAELERLAAPIALHPDPLISIILPAAAYPLEVVQAARFVKDTNNIPKLDAQPWDDNVKAVAKFPELIAQMDADLQWTVDLGVAFVEQPKELMDKIQELRGKAFDAGTLQSTPQQVVTVTNVVVLQTNITQQVTVTNQIVQVEPADPEVIYVPTYPSTVYYPPPNYVYDPFAPLISFGVGMAVGAIIANNCDWYGGAIWVGGGGIWVGGGWGGSDVDINIDVDNINIDRDARVDPRTGERSRAERPAQQKWEPDPNRLRTSGAPTTRDSREARGWGSPSARPATTGGGSVSTWPGGGSTSGRPGGVADSRWPGEGPTARPTTTQRDVQGGRLDSGGQRSTDWPGASSVRSGGTERRSSAQTSPSIRRSSGGYPSSAFGGVSDRSNVQRASQRGRSSRGGGGGGGRRR